MKPTLFNKTQTALADRWGTTQMNISNSAKAGCDFDAPDKTVARWFLKNSKRKSKGLSDAIAEVLQPDPVKLKDGDEVRTLEQMRDYYSLQLDAASKADDLDREAVKFWNDLLLKADESLRRSQAHATKLGIDRGEVLSRAEVERILQTMFWAGNACCNRFSLQISGRLSEKPPAEVHKILKPMMTALLMFEPMKRLAKTPGDVNLPQWVIDCAMTERSFYLKP
jgi:hypothetical protein